LRRRRTPRGLLQQLGQDVDAALPGHDDVEEDDVGLERARAEDRVFCVTRLADDLDVLFVVEQHSQSGPHDRVVVDDDDADHSGTSTASVVPPSGVDSSVSRPS
jgi:hypothetical protein